MCGCGNGAASVAARRSESLCGVVGGHGIVRRVRMRWRGWRGSRGCDVEGLGQGVVGELDVDLTGALAVVREAEPAIVLPLRKSWREVDGGAPDIVGFLVGSVAHEFECVGRRTVVDDFELHLLVPKRCGSAASVWQCAEPGAVDAYLSDGVLCVVRALACEMPALEHDADQRAAVPQHGRRQGRGAVGGSWMTKRFDRRGRLGAAALGGGRGTRCGCCERVCERRAAW